MAKKKLISTKMKIIMASVLIGSIASFVSAGVILYNSNYKLSNYFDISNWEFNFYNTSNTDYHGNVLFTDNIAINEIEKIDLVFDSNIAQFETYNGDSMEISLCSFNNLSIDNTTSPFVVNSENNTLKISPNLDTLSSLSKGNYKFVIKVPTSYTKALSINSLSGNITLNSLNITSLDIKTDKSNIYLNSITCNDGNINVTNGSLHSKNLNSKELNIHGIDSYISSSELSGNVNISSVKSELTCTVGSNLTNLKASVNSGNIHLNVPRNGNLTINSSIINGSFNNDISDFDDYHDDYDKPPAPFILGNGENKIDLSSVDGGIYISD